MRRVRRSFAAAVALAVAFLGTAVITGATGAQAAVLACGSTITTSTTLTADVGPCNTTHGLIVRNAHNIVLDLGGHRVFSTAPLPRNNGVDQDGFYIPADTVGILIIDSTNVTVRNGTVDRFTAGVSIENGSGNTVQNMTLQNNQGPCIGEDFSTFAIGQYGDGVVIFGSPNNRILNNRILNNGPFSGIAIVANHIFITRAVPPFPSGTIVSNNLIEGNNLCFADIGIRIEGPGASNTQVTNNIVRRSFQEGIVVHPVNVIDFRPLFQNPPQCQNRGFPSPSLPQCPIQNPLNPTNDNNLIRNNTVTLNGYGGPQVPAGPNRLNNPSAQAATGINLLSFCGYGARSNATGNRIEANIVTRNAGDGITAGGCPLGQNPANGTFPGFTNSQILNNTAVDNNGKGCGVLPPVPGCGARPTVQRFDLHDSTHQINCPSTSASTQTICAGLGFPAPPPSGPFVGTPVIQPGGTPCDANVWFGNTYRTAFPACTTAGGRLAGSSSPSSSASTAQESTTSAMQAAPVPTADIVLPLRQPRR